MFINVVDNIADIYERMEKSTQWAGIRKTALNVWLDEEEFLTRQLAHLTEKPYYTVARQHELANFYELLFSDKPKFYLSYPITLLTDTPEEIKRIRELGAKLMLNVPATMSELDDDVIEQIKTWTISRDYQFVHQSDFVVVLYPTDKLSPGVLSEMNYASRHNKPVYAVYSETRSIFFENLCDKIFDTFEELEDFLKETYQNGWKLNTTASLKSRLTNYGL